MLYDTDYISSCIFSWCLQGVCIMSSDPICYELLQHMLLNACALYKATQ